MTIKVTECDNCPFCVDDFDFECVGNAGLRYCNYKKRTLGNVHFDEYLIGTYDDIPPPTPDWCPLQIEKVVITYE